MIWAHDRVLLLFCICYIILNKQKINIPSNITIKVPKVSKV